MFDWLAYYEERRLDPDWRERWHEDDDADGWEDIDELYDYDE